ncbi:MAG: RICIN domain-containing protein [Clostridia bacterium]|nr:RICIN domain-containing protein [Clostridia bacterium]
MKKIKKLVSVLLAVTLLMTLSYLAAAENETPILPEQNVQISDNDIVTPLAETPSIVNNGVYRIKNVGSGKYLNLHYGVDADGTNIYQWTYDGSTEQKWRISYNYATQAYQIYSMSSSGGKNRVLDVTRGSNPLTSGQNVKLYTPTDPISQEVDFYMVSSGKYRIVMKNNTDLCLTSYGTSNGTSGGTSSTSAGNVFISNYTGSDNQKWAFEYTGTKVVVAPTGWIDSVSDTAISGWAWRSDLPNSPVSVSFDITNNDTGDYYYLSTTANVFRADLVNAGYGNGYHGFRCEIDWLNFTAGNYTITAYVGHGGSTYNLSGNPKTYVNAINNIYSNEMNEGASYVYPLDGGVLAGVGFRITCNAFVDTTTITNRIVTKVTTFACTEPNPNPEINSPDITVGVTTLNGTNISMVEDRNVLVSPTWVWDCKVGNPNMVASQNSVYSSTVSVMLNGAIYPLQTIVNTFTF